MIDVYNCRARAPRYYYRAPKCAPGETFLDCLPVNDFQLLFPWEIFKDAWPFIKVKKGRQVWYYSEDKSRLIAKVTEAWATADRLEKAGFDPSQAFVPPNLQAIRDEARNRFPEAFKDQPGAKSGPDPFTITVPGITDILKLPGLDSPDLRRERADRYSQQHSGLPQGLKWVPALLTKLDDAQDLLFTALALAIPLLVRIAPRLLPLAGWLLLANDLLNIGT